MVINIPKVEPFTFIASTAFDERVQLADKLNEIIDALNMVGDIPDIQAQIVALSSTVSTIQAELASTDANLDELTEQVNSLISEVNDTIKTQMTALQGEVSSLDSRMDTAASDISGIKTKDMEQDEEIAGLLGEVIDKVSMATPNHGSIQIQVDHEDGTNDISDPIDMGLVKEGGITLLSSGQNRAFKLHIELTDGTSWETNDFIIPPGGGTDVTVTSITLSQGTTADTMKVSIGLSDGTPLDSNDYPVAAPTTVSALATKVTKVESDVAAVTNRVTTAEGDISDLTDRVTSLEESGSYTLVPATSEVLGGVKIGTNINIQADGTISISTASSSRAGVMTPAHVSNLNKAAVASTLMFTGDASKVTLHIDNISSSEFTKDIPAAADGGAGTIDAAAYQKLSNVPDPSTIATDAEISDLQEQITGLKLSKPNQNEIQLNGDNVTIVETISGTVDDDGNLVITVNGVSGSGIPLPATEPDWNTNLDISGTVVVSSSSGLTHDEYDGSVTNEISSSGNPNPASSLIRYKNYILDLGGDAFIDSIYIKKDGGRQYLMNGDISLFPVISDKIQALKETIGDFKYAVCINTSGRGFADYMELTLPRYYNTADYIGDTATNTPPSGFAIDTTDVRTGTFPFCVVPLLEPPE